MQNTLKRRKQMIDYQSTPTPPAKKSGGNPLMLIISGILVVALIAVGVLYGMEAGKLSKANKNIDDLTANVAGLNGQLTTEKANVASLQTQLDTAKANAADLQTQLTASQGKVTSLTSGLADANAKVTSLTADLATANAKVTSTQTSLDKASADLATAVATNTAQAATLKQIQDPKHFSNLSELTSWLAKDDTNTNSTYASLSRLPGLMCCK
jgi:septal ring factor EnvC (AmiA/AmiB activator)